MQLFTQKNSNAVVTWLQISWDEIKNDRVMICY